MLIINNHFAHSMVKSDGCRTESCSEDGDQQNVWQVPAGDKLRRSILHVGSWGHDRTAGRTTGDEG